MIPDPEVTDLQVLGHGYWVPKLRVVESRICRGSGGFGLGGEGFLGVGWMRFAGRKLSDESLMFGSPSVGKSLIRIDESSFD